MGTERWGPLLAPTFYAQAKWPQIARGGFGGKAPATPKDGSWDYSSPPPDSVIYAFQDGEYPQESE